MKKALSFGFIICLLGMKVHAQNGKITVTVTNFKSQKGLVLCCLNNKEDGFPGEQNKALSCQKISIAGSKVQFTFLNVVPGTYALAAYHDENNDGTLNTNFLGIPKEGVGVSNNKMRNFSSPKYNEAKFAVPANGEIKMEIKLKNYN